MLGFGEICKKSLDLEKFVKNLGICRNLPKIFGFGEICDKSWDLKKWRNF